MKKFGIWAVATALFFAPMGLSSCSMGSSASEMKGSLNFTQDDLTEKPFKAIDVDVIADVYYTQNDGNECSVKMDYSAIKDQEFVKKLKEKLKVVYRDGEVKIGLNLIPKFLAIRGVYHIGFHACSHKGGTYRFDFF